MSRGRDNQRSRVYAWERHAVGKVARVEGGELVRNASFTHNTGDFGDLAACQAFVDLVWKAERARYGIKRKQPPAVQRPSWGQRRAYAHSYHAISLPKWCRNEWMILHEVAHHLTPDDETHGPRFVGVLIGLLHRHAGFDVPELVESATRDGVKVYERSIGPFSAVTLSARLLEVLPATDMEAALDLGVHWRQVRGAAMQLIRRGRARWFRGRLVRCAGPETVGETV